MEPFSVIVLAAGGSSRLGRSKQLVEWRGEPLISRICRAALGSGAEQVIAVLGSNHEQVSAAVPAGVEIVVNAAWAEGLSTSIAAGIPAVRCGRVVIVLVDQPFVTGAIIAKLALLLKEYPISATAYPDGSLGVPAGFRSEWFETLARLKGDRGAKQLLAENAGIVGRLTHVEVDDLDTDQDIERLSQ